MKKLILSFVLIIGFISVLHAQNYQGSIATTDFTTGLTILQPDNVTGVPDGWICQIIIPGLDGVIDPPNTDGSPGGDDLLCNGGGNNFWDFTWNSSWTGIQGQHYGTVQFLWPNTGQGTEPCANVGENFYLRLFNNTTVATATKYLNSALFLLPAANGDLYFNTTAYWDYGTQFNWQDIPSDDGPYIYLQVEYFDGTPCDFDLGELDAATVTNLTTSTVLTWPNTALSAYADTFKVDMNGFASNGDCIKFEISATPNGGGAQETNDVTYCVSGICDQMWTFANGFGLTLPVELSAFTITFMNDYTLIKWTTSSETDVNGFNIYRNTEDNIGLADKINVTLIPGNGTTSQPNNYEFHDIDQLDYQTTYYYWLEAVNYGGGTNVYGSFEYTPEVGQGGYEDTFDESMLMNKPNPFGGSTTIYYEIKGMLITEPVKISIYNALGQLLVEDTAYHGSYNFDATNYPTGIYFYKVETEHYKNIKKMMVIR